MRATTPNAGVRDSYFDLVRAFPLRPIRSEHELDRATAVLTRLVKSKPEEKMDSGERDYFEALTLMVQQVEQRRRNSALARTTPVERLKFLMEETGMNVGDVGRVIGSQPGASLILHGKRAMSKAQILKLASHFELSPAVFMG